ncbi:hypothetical protein AB838_10965 [Rhodobacteraceae bacterium (ex Bugula neritina AB1)]|nr:hypothetical protein AB838_10965 [Rhodobacteraceae bacterium (ex Bugula neritina AB1)]
MPSSTSPLSPAAFGPATRGLSAQVISRLETAQVIRHDLAALLTLQDKVRIGGNFTLADQRIDRQNQRPARSSMLRHRQQRTANSFLFATPAAV